MRKSICFAILCAFAVGGCSSAGDSAGLPGPMGSRSVTQGGAQDIGFFRSVVESGGVPRPSTIDPVGFFAEHAVDLPPADCGDSVCVHGNLAVAPGIDQESNWTMAFLAMNTPVDARDLERPVADAVGGLRDVHELPLRLLRRHVVGLHLHDAADERQPFG